MKKHYIVETHLLKLICDALARLDDASRILAAINQSVPPGEVWGAAVCIRSSLATAIRDFNAYRRAFERMEGGKCAANVFQ